MPDVKRKRKHKPTDRKGGGQPGNKNALRHGFYSQYFTVAENRMLDKDIAADHILSGIKSMQIKALRLFKLTPLNKIDEDELKTFDRLIATMIYLNTAERTILLARGHGGQIAQDIWDAIMELNPDEEL